MAETGVELQGWRDSVQVFPLEISSLLTTWKSTRSCRGAGGCSSFHCFNRLLLDSNNFKDLFSTTNKQNGIYLDCLWKNVEKSERVQILKKIKALRSKWESGNRRFNSRFLISFFVVRKVGERRSDRITQLLISTHTLGKVWLQFPEKQTAAGRGCSITSAIGLHHCHKSIPHEPFENILPCMLSRLDSTALPVLIFMNSCMEDWRLFSLGLCVCAHFEGWDMGCHK